MVVPGHWNARIHPILTLVLGLFIGCLPTPCVVAATFAVNSTVDVVDASPGDGICRTAPGNTVCTLRAAVMEANSLAGADTINLQANTTYMLELPGIDDLGLNGDLDVLDSVTIVGAGAASSIIDGNGIVVGDRIMTVYNCIGVAASSFGQCLNGTSAIVAAISGVGFKRGRRLSDSGAGGGGLLNWGTLSIHSCAFTENVGVNGGGIKNWGTVAISNTTVAGNTAVGEPASSLQPVGGGIYSRGPGGLTLVDSTVRDNGLSGASVSDPTGGGIALFTSPATINRSTVSNNFSHGFGGGISSLGSSLNLINTTLSGNLSYRSGGGLLVNGGTVGLYNVTITVNIANADAFGTGDLGGGVYREAGSLTFRNSIITNNFHAIQGSGSFALDDCLGAITSAGNSIVTSPANCTIAGSYAAVGASLGPLQNNGGPTQTHALLMGSAAINAGNPAGCTDPVGAILTTDQRGEPRPFGAACDIGAFEAGDGVFKDGFES